MKSFTLLFALLGSLLLAAPTSNAQVIVAHRGASYDAPENTISAFREAWAQAADGVEADFYVTKDQQIVCIHDKDTKRTAGKNLVVADSTLDELRQLEYGSWKDARFKGEPIPTFAEVMAVIPEARMFVIELKTGPEIVPLLKAELDRLKPSAKDLLIIAFNKDTVKAVKQQLPAIRTHWLTGFKQDKVTGKWSPTATDVATSLKETGADGIGFQGRREVVTAEFLDGLKQHGLKEFHVWTLDDPKDAQFYRDLGAVGITTNRPAFIRDALTQR
ncbi:MAG: glycerophosphodiester phosphodiesterase [Planctomycetaceae bacterium]|nr:glycerophosphodiester phosphodiesterase [Planctomycetaceae bacterium]